MILNLPHDAMLFENRDRANSASGASAYFAGNRYSYRKKLQINNCWEKNLILYRFDAISGTDRKMEVSGAGELQGFWSAVSNTDDSFLFGTYSTYYGKALIAVRAGYKEGDITVTVKAGDLETKMLTIQVRR